MDISKELEEFESSADCGDSLVQQMKVQEEELRKKRYLIRVMSVTKKFENLIDTGLFKNAGIEFIKFELDLIPRRVGDKVYTFSFEFFNKNKEMISCYVDKDKSVITDEANQVKKIFQPFILYEGLAPDLVSSQIHDGSKHTLEITNDIRNKILELFLSQELKQIYDYNKMHRDLPDNNRNKAIKVKV